jgi:hypothetical protein
MKKAKLVHAAKYALLNLECGKCDTGVIQIFRKWARGGIVTTLVSGCLDCGYEYGLKQSESLKPYTRDDITWP